jgi:hypothetical protein
MIANIANRAIYEYPYISQVTGNHLTSTALSRAKHLFDPELIGFMVYFLDKDRISMQKVFSSNTYNLMQ